MKQITWGGPLFITKRKFIHFLMIVFLLVPTIACTQVMNPLDKQTKVLPVLPNSLWPNKNNVDDKTELNLPYGTIVITQKPISCNNTSVIKNYIQNSSGMIPVTFGTSLNSMGGIKSLIQIYANLINKQFAIVEHFTTKKSCILTQGHNFEIIMPEQMVLK